ncbi:MAG: hypothetical protein ACTFAL_08815 [Candidatus Electronema sp. V4]|uniref:hypothetical protein n=1 Tax=Candidatus Electronema sp. V4 TaxID=3454756 RepID=UPI00405539E2
MNNKIRVSCAVVGIVAATFGCSASHAAFYAGWGTIGICPADDPDFWCAGWGTIWHRDTDFSLCFAGNSVDERPNRVGITLEHLRHFEWAANIRFHPPGNKTIRIQSGNPIVATDWRCPDTSDSNGNPADGDLGDIRILLWTYGNINWWDKTGYVGGEKCYISNCSAKTCNLSWGGVANETVISRWCNYNVKLNDPAPDYDKNLYYLNHTLHEIGHRLGLGHEFDRSDETLDCFDDDGAPVIGMIQNGENYPTDANGKTSTSSMIFMTPFDKSSVMNYSFKNCDVVGNFDFTGFSAYDRLALRILYPEKDMIAEFTGELVVNAGQPLFLKNSWEKLGATVDGNHPVAMNFSWKIDGVQISTLPDLDISLPAGKHSLEYSYQDFLGRSYYAQSQVEVLNFTAFNQLMASQAAIISAANVTSSTAAAINALQPAFQLLLQ